MLVVLFFKWGGKQKKKEKNEEEAHYRAIAEEVSPVEYLRNVQKKKDSISAIMKFDDIHNLLEHSSSQKQKEGKDALTKG